MLSLRLPCTFPPVLRASEKQVGGGGRLEDREYNSVGDDRGIGGYGGV
jgi:hypothetical protein